MDRIRYAWGESSLGSFLAAVSDAGLVSFEFRSRRDGVPGSLHERLAGSELVEDAAGLAGTVAVVAVEVVHVSSASDDEVKAAVERFAVASGREQSQVPTPHASRRPRGHRGVGRDLASELAQSRGVLELRRHRGRVVLVGA